MKFVEGVPRDVQLQAEKLQLAYQDPKNYLCTTSRKQLQISQFGKGKIFGDYCIDQDVDLERRPNEIAEVHHQEPYSILTFNPAQLIYIERQIFAQIIEQEDS